MKTNLSKLAIALAMIATMAVSFTSCSKDNDNSNDPINPTEKDLYPSMSKGDYFFINSEILDYFDIKTTYTDAQGKQQTINIAPDKYASEKFKADRLAVINENSKRTYSVTKLHSLYFEPSVLSNETVKKSIKVEVTQKDVAQPTKSPDVIIYTLSKSNTNTCIPNQSAQTGLDISKVQEYITKRLETFVKYL
ncbi:MAG: hypothetical protein HUK07_00830 [Bacteroidaceae bacterium]|nr:hypothetical protein [Bacteroidaceae bacterium]